MIHLTSNSKWLPRLARSPSTWQGSCKRRKAPSPFALCQDSGSSYDYDVLGEEIDPDALFEEFEAALKNFSSLFGSSTKSDSQTDQAVQNYFIHLLCRMIFGSNKIESAGGSLDITYRLCKGIFEGLEGPDEIGERDPNYQVLKTELQQKGLPSGVEAVLRTRREIVQHAEATQHIMHQVAVLGKDITEELILQTHRLLTHQIDCHDSGLAWAQYSGVYRSTPVCAGFTAFPAPSQVPRLMRDMVAELQADLALAAQQGALDPVALSAKYCHKFVNIHPFADGNGRTCRLVLNALLLKYCCLLVCYGQDDADRDQYLGIAARGSASEMDDLDDHDHDAPAKHWKGLASFNQAHATNTARELVKILKKE